MYYYYLHFYNYLYHFDSYLNQYLIYFQLMLVVMEPYMYHQNLITDNKIVGLNLQGLNL